VAEEVNESQAKTEHHTKTQRFYIARHRIATGLMIFVVVVGLPIVAIPSLRHRLSDRAMALKSALAGGITPATLDVGANHAPFPTEYESPLPLPPRAPELPSLDRVFTMDGRTAHSSPVPSPPPRTPTRRPKVQASIPSPPPDTESEVPTVVAQATPVAEPELKYQKGKAEQEAYEVLLKSSPTVAALVQGSNPSLKFKSWDAASRGEDTYWVRLKFQSEGIPEAEYIWQVKVQANQATPLNFNARSLAQ
jgi:hypothetical protein